MTSLNEEHSNGKYRGQEQHARLEGINDLSVIGGREQGSGEGSTKRLA